MVAGLEGGFCLKIMAIDYGDAHVSDGELVWDLGSISVERTGQTLRTVWFTEPVPFENGNYGAGEFLGMELAPDVPDAVSVLPPAGEGGARRLPQAGRRMREKSLSRPVAMGKALPHHPQCAHWGSFPRWGKHDPSPKASPSIPSCGAAALPFFMSAASFFPPEAGSISPAGNRPETGRRAAGCGRSCRPRQRPAPSPAAWCRSRCRECARPTCRRC